MRKQIVGWGVLAAVLAVFLPLRAEFAHSATLVVSGYNGPALANFPILVRLSPERISGFSYNDVTSATGADIAFKTESGQLCPHEVDTWDTSGESLVWVRVPLLEPYCRIVAQWGDAEATAHQASRDLWSSVGTGGKYFGVWHFSEEITASTAATTASADSAKWDENIDMDAEPVVSYSGNMSEMVSDEGIVGHSRWNSRQNARFHTGLRAKDSNRQTFGAAITLSGWFNAANMDAKDFTLFARRNTSETGGFYLKRQTNGKFRMEASAYADGFEPSPAPNFLSNWVHVAAVYDDTTRVLYTNGVEMARKANATALSDVSKRVAFGAGNSGHDYAFGGRYDEIRILSFAADGAWVAAEYQTVTKSDFVTMYVPGDEEVTLVAEPAGSGSFVVDGEPVAAGTVSVADSDAVVFSAVPAAGYEFLRWEGAGILPQDAISTNVTLPVLAALTLKAIFYPVGEGHVGTDVSWASGAASFGPGDRVTVPEGATVVLSEPTPHLASFDVFGTVVVSNWFSRILADAVNVRSGGTIRAGCDAPMLNGGVSNRVWLAGATLCVEDGGIVSANAAGYAGTNGPCWTAIVERKSVSASVNISPYGGAYGGAPGYDSVVEISPAWGSPPQPYGSVDWPFDPGSGGGAYIRAGGGAIFLDFTGAVSISGTVCANASTKWFAGYPRWESSLSSGSWGYHNASSGSGGGIVIRCRTVSGSGTVSANGYLYDGGSVGYGGGSGGRIAVHYDAVAQSNVACNIRFEAMRGISYGKRDGKRGIYAGGPGTLWFTDNLFLTSYLATGWKFGGEWHSGSGSPDRLSVDGDLIMDGALMRFAGSGLSIDVSGDLVLTGATAHANASGLSFTSPVAFSVGGSVRVTGALLEFGGGGTVEIGGDLTMSGPESQYTAARLAVKALPTNMTSTAATRLAVGGTWALNGYSACFVACDAETGAAPELSAEDLFVDDNAAIDASGLGFGATAGPGYSAATVGSSHGGTGGRNNDAAWATPKPVYDDEENPLLPGSGSSRDFAGGVVNLSVARTANIRGKILADSLNSMIRVDPGYVLGSSGGSINLRTYRLRGGENSRVSAVGGSSWDLSGTRRYYDDVGTGGGGRIAIRVSVDKTDWRGNDERVNASAFPYTSISTVAQDGTVWWGGVLPLVIIVQ